MMAPGSDEEEELRSVALQTSKSILLARQRAEQEFLLSVLASSVDAVVTCDERGTILSFNGEAERMFGYASAEVVGQSLTTLLAEPDHSEYEGYFADYLRTGQVKVVGTSREVLGRRKEGATLPIDLAMSEFLLHDRRHFNGVLRDITNRKKLEEQLRQAQKMEAVGQLAGGIAHDFNNLLTVICGCGELLLCDVGADDPKRELLAAILQAGERATTLTRQLLAFSRKQILEPKLLNLNEVVKTFERLVRRLIGEDIRLTVILDPTIRPVKADPNQLEQVLVNLAVNARDAMPQGGSLTIETRNVEFGERDGVDHPECRPGRYVLVSMTDTGCGMTAETQSHIFEPFFTTKESGKGTGLGLAMVYGIVNQSNGFVTVSSEVGKGSSFQVYLPHFQEPASEPVSDSGGPIPRGDETLLLVEDEKSVRQYAQYVLRTCGYTVLSAADGEEALRLAKEHGPPIDLLVCDVVMPNLSGRVVAERVSALKPGIKVLFVSGYTDDAVVRHGIVRAEMPFLHKPFSMSQLAQKVRDVLDRGEPPGRNAGT